MKILQGMRWSKPIGWEAISPMNMSWVILLLAQGNPYHWWYGNDEDTDNLVRVIVKVSALTGLLFLVLRTIRRWWSHYGKDAGLGNVPINEPGYMNKDKESVDRDPDPDDIRFNESLETAGTIEEDDKLPKVSSVGDDGIFANDIPSTESPDETMNGTVVEEVSVPRIYVIGFSEIDEWEDIRIGDGYISLLETIGPEWKKFYHEHLDIERYGGDGNSVIEFDISDHCDLNHLDTEEGIIEVLLKIRKFRDGLLLKLMLNGIGILEVTLRNMGRVEALLKERLGMLRGRVSEEYSNDDIGQVESDNRTIERIDTSIVPEDEIDAVSRSVPGAERKIIDTVMTHDEPTGDCLPNDSNTSGITESLPIYDEFRLERMHELRFGTPDEDGDTEDVREAQFQHLHLLRMMVMQFKEFIDHHRSPSLRFHWGKDGLMRGGIDPDRGVLIGSAIRSMERVLNRHNKILLYFDIEHDGNNESKESIGDIDGTEVDRVNGNDTDDGINGYYRLKYLGNVDEYDTAKRDFIYLSSQINYLVDLFALISHQSPENHRSEISRNTIIDLLVGTRERVRIYLESRGINVYFGESSEDTMGIPNARRDNDDTGHDDTDIHTVMEPNDGDSDSEDWLDLVLDGIPDNTTFTE